MLTIEKFSQVLLPLLDSNQWVLAYSGGLDSHVLLHLLASLRDQMPEVSVRAVHIHHGLSPNADDWAEHCRAVCHDLNVPFTSKSVSLSIKTGDSLEAVARELRYRVLGEQLNEQECLLTAHTRNDQAETILLQLLRGAGPRGLAAMPAQKSLGSQQLLRPLLNWTREELYEYAIQSQLQWVEDESNQETRFDRNYLRQEILPVLKTRWSAVSQNLARSATHSAEASGLLDDLADIDLGHIADEVEQRVQITPLVKLTAERQRNALRRWFNRQSLPVPNTQKLQYIQEEMQKQRQDTSFCLCWGEIEMRRYRDYFYVIPKQAECDTQTVLEWNLTNELLLPNHLGRLEVQKSTVGECVSEALWGKTMTVCFRQGGELCRLPNREGSHSLKKLFQEWGVPPWQRNRIPLLFYKEELVAVIGYCVCEQFIVEPGRVGYQVQHLGK